MLDNWLFVLGLGPSIIILSILSILKVGVATSILFIVVSIGICLYAIFKNDFDINVKYLCLFGAFIIFMTGLVGCLEDIALIELTYFYLMYGVLIVYSVLFMIFNINLIYNGSSVVINV